MDGGRGLRKNSVHKEENRRRFSGKAVKKREREKEIKRERKKEKKKKRRKERKKERKKERWSVIFF